MQKCISPEIDIGGGEKSGDHDGVGAGKAQHRPGATPHSSPLPVPRQNENTQCTLSYDTRVWPTGPRVHGTQAFAMNLF